MHRRRRVNPKDTMTNRPTVEPVDQRRLRTGDRIALLVNPAARSTGDQASIASAISALERRYRVELIAPQQVSELDDAARAAAASSAAVIVAGGDGTLHRVINAIEGLDITIGLLPLGTGNDFARALKLPEAPAGAAARILDGRIRQIDLVAVNSRLFCTVGVLGLAAEGTLAFDRLLRPGSWSRPLMRAIGGWSYRIAGLSALLSRGSRLERMAIGCAGSSVITRPRGDNGLPLAGEEQISSKDGASEPRGVFGAFVTNTTMLGGGMAVPIDSDMADGQLEIACIDAMPRARLYWAFLCLANGWRVPDGVLRVVRTTRAVITCDRSLPFAADGELICEDNRFDVAVRPGALSVIC